MSGQQPLCQAPSCPPFWLMFSSPQQGRRSSCSCGDAWAPRPRCRSHSLSSADAGWLRYRTITFHISDSEDDDDDEGNNASSTEDTPHPTPERPRSAAPAKHPLSRVKALQLGSSAQPSQAAFPPSPQAGRPPMSPLLLGKKGSKKRRRSAGCQSRRFSQNSPPAAFSPHRLKQQQRPSSAGPAVKNRKQVRSSVSFRGKRWPGFPRRLPPACLPSISVRLFLTSLSLMTSGAEFRPLLWAFLRLGGRAAVSSEPGGAGAAGEHHSQGVSSTHSHPGTAEDWLPQSGQGIGPAFKLGIGKLQQDRNLILIM